MKRIIVLIIFSFVIKLSVFAQSIDNFELDKYQWIEADTLKHISIGPVIGTKDDFYKIVYHIKRNEAVFFDIFEYDGQFFYDYKLKQEKFDTIPAIAPKKIGDYGKLTDSEGIVGIYEYYSNDDVDVDYFEIRKISNDSFYYEIFLGYNNSGYHLLSKKENSYVSDSTFCTWENLFYNKLFEVDRSEWFYLTRDFHKKLNDKFYIVLSDYDSVYKKISVVTEDEQYELFPEEFFIQEGGKYNFYWNLNFYEQNSFDSKKEVFEKSQIVTVLKKNPEWISEKNKNTMWFKVQLPDSRIGWVTGLSLSGNRKDIKYRNAVCNAFNVRVRTKPNLSGSILALIEQGLEVKVEKHSLEKTEINGESWYWYKIKSDLIPRGEGWVYGKYLDIEE